MRNENINNPETSTEPTFSKISCAYQGITLYIVADKGKIIHLTFAQDLHQKAISRLTTKYPESIFTTDTRSEKLCHQFFEYFKGRSNILPPSSNWPFLQQGTPFQRQVWELISQIPFGETRTYGFLAKKLKKPGGARAIGQACHTNPLALIIPCHRVVGANSIGGFAGGSDVKKRLITMEKQRAKKNQ